MFVVPPRISTLFLLFQFFFFFSLCEWIKTICCRQTVHCWSNHLRRTGPRLLQVVAYIKWIEAPRRCGLSCGKCNMSGRLIVVTVVKVAFFSLHGAPAYLESWSFRSVSPAVGLWRPCWSLWHLNLKCCQFEGELMFCPEETLLGFRFTPGQGPDLKKQN